MRQWHKDGGITELMGSEERRLFLFGRWTIQNNGERRYEHLLYR